MACNLVPSDVHDMATRVGKEFQRLIEEYGCSSVSTLVPTVVEALEHLENYVEQYQKVQTQNFKLMLEQDSLATERERREKLKEENAVSVSQGSAGDRSCAIRRLPKKACCYQSSPALRPASLWTGEQRTQYVFPSKSCS